MLAVDEYDGWCEYGGICHDITTALMYGETLVNNIYYSRYAAAFTPTGYSKYTAGKPKKHQFGCPKRTTSSCYFP
ncbi:hypothetical protein ACFQ36_20565 [Arthrobacter sp. GCM10027362]|uniref:hypothetical protein n=1 Tax=Arthrobacter sp. GCM10027362 TaxID=3273379 RepID=UPI00364145A2